MGLIESLAKVSHVGEVARLLRSFGRLHRSAIGRRELLELADRTAGAGYRYPNPKPALTLAYQLGLVASQGPRASLTPVGKLFIKEIAAEPLDLTPHQAKLLIGILLDDVGLKHGVASVLRFFRKAPDGRVQARLQDFSVEEPTTTCIKILQQLRILSYGDGFLILNPEFEAILPPALIGATRVDEETLWRKLAAQRERGRIAEEFVVERERDRLAMAGRADLAELVFRVSTIDVSAGYDIESYEKDGSPRCIEVKSSTGVRVQFEWSIGERRKASELRGRYWIYFVPMAHLLPESKCDVLLIEDPVAFVDSGRLSESPASFVVQERPQRAADETAVELSFTGSMITW